MTPHPPQSPSTDHSGFWSERYRSGEAGWDLGGPTPVFLELLRTRRLPPGHALVPGCGTGHDALAFAGAGFSVTGLDFAPEPLAEARLRASDVGLKAEFVQADFFSLGDEYTAVFDYIIEYTMYCAIHPSRRALYAETAGRVLKPGGRLVALFFPVEDRPGGPPFGVDIAETERLLSSRFHLVSSEIHPATIKPRRGREVLTIWERLP